MLMQAQAAAAAVFSNKWWHELLLPASPVTWTEKLLRPVLVYIVLLMIFRVASKRELAQATLFDFLIILLISNVVQNAIIGNDNSVLGAIAGAVVMVSLSAALNKITSRSRNLRIILEGKPVLLVKNGKIFDEIMKQNSVSRNDLLSSIRKAGILRLCDVAYAILELDGTISILKDEDKNQGEPHDCLPSEIVGDVSAEMNEHDERHGRLHLFHLHEKTPPNEAEV